MYPHDYSFLDLVMLPGVLTAVLSMVLLAAPLGWALAIAVGGPFRRRTPA